MTQENPMKFKFQRQQIKLWLEHGRARSLMYCPGLSSYNGGYVARQAKSTDHLVLHRRSLLTPDTWYLLSQANQSVMGSHYLAFASSGPSTLHALSLSLLLSTCWKTSHPKRWLPTPPVTSGADPSPPGWCLGRPSLPSLPPS